MRVRTYNGLTLVGDDACDRLTFHVDPLNSTITMHPQTCTWAPDSVAFSGTYVHVKSEAVRLQEVQSGRIDPGSYCRVGGCDLPESDTDDEDRSGGRCIVHERRWQRCYRNQLKRGVEDTWARSYADSQTPLD